MACNLDDVYDLTRFILPAVCRKWRSVAIGMESLWKKVPILLHRVYAMKLGSLCIQRSGSALIDLIISDTPNFPFEPPFFRWNEYRQYDDARLHGELEADGSVREIEDDYFGEEVEDLNEDDSYDAPSHSSELMDARLENVINLLRPHIHRWRALVIDVVAFRTLMGLTSQHGCAAALEELDLSCTDSSYHDGGRPADDLTLGLEMPVLTVLRLSGMPVRLVRDPSFTLMAPPSLRELSLSDYIYKEYVQQESQHDFTIAQLLDALRRPCSRGLTKLKLRSMHLQETSTMYDGFNGYVMGSLEELVLASVSASLVEGLWRFVDLPLMDKLVLSPPVLSSWDPFEIPDKPLPGLHALHLTNGCSPWGYTSDPVDQILRNGPSVRSVVLEDLPETYSRMLIYMWIEHVERCAHLASLKIVMEGGWRGDLVRSLENPLRQLVEARSSITAGGALEEVHMSQGGHVSDEYRAWMGARLNVFTWEAGDALVYAASPEMDQYIYMDSDALDNEDDDAADHV